MKIEELDKINNKNKKITFKKILFIAVTILVVTIVIFIVVKLNKKDFTANANGKPIIVENVDVESIENKTREVIDSINYLNQVFASDKFDESTRYNNDGGLSCVKYTGESAEMYINVARTIYENPFSSKGYFDVKTEGEREDLYVCKPSCDVSVIDTNSVRIVKDKKENEKGIEIAGKSYIMKKTDDIWKFSEPIVTCTEN